MSRIKSKFDSSVRVSSPDERAVSPVIGVILMVAIVVILAAVIGFFVLGLGSEQNTAPQASFTFSSGGGSTTITHDGGDTLQSSQTGIVVGGGAPTTWAANGTVSAGNSKTVSAGSGTDIRVTYTNDNGQTSTLATYTVP